MKTMKGRILKKLRSIPALGDSSQMPRILRLHASDGTPPATPLDPCWLHIDETPRGCGTPGRVLQELPLVKDCKLQDEQEQEGQCVTSSNSMEGSLCKGTIVSVDEPDIIDVDELMRDLEEDEEEDDAYYLHEISDKENIGPAQAVRPTGKDAKCRASPPPFNRRQSLSSSTPYPRTGSRGPTVRWCPMPTSENRNESPFRRPDPNSASLFDPELLAAFEQAVMDHMRSYEKFLNSRACSTAVEEEGCEQKLDRQQRLEDGSIDADHFLEQIASEVTGNQTCATDNIICEEDGDEDPWRGFELRCPPGGEDAVVLYTTTLRGIRKTFEDCGSVRFLLETLRVRFCERDISMHLGYREELWRVLGEKAIPPRLFVRGRYIGGADEVMGLHERGLLLSLLRGLSADRPGGAPCNGCGGVGFLVCGECSGSRKMVGLERGETARCPACNENGLVVCAMCSSS